MCNLKPIALMIAIILAVPITVRAATSSLVVAAWLPYWKTASGTPEVLAHLALLSEFSPFSYEVKPADGTLIDRMKLDQNPWTTLLPAVNKRGIKIIPTIMWNDQAAIHKTLSSPSWRKVHEARIVIEAIQRGWDGIDIDYENKAQATGPYFSIFIRELSQLLHKAGQTLSCTIEARTPPDSRFLVVPARVEYTNHYPTINLNCDEVRIMAYDQSTVDIKLNKQNMPQGYYVPVADPAWVEKVLKLAVKDIAPKKILLGIPTYGYEYEVTDKRTYYDYKKIRALTWADAVALAQSVEAIPQRNVAGEMSFTYQKDGRTRIVWWSDAGAVADKVALAKKLGLRGVVLFRLDGQSDPLIWDKLK